MHVDADARRVRATGRHAGLALLQFGCRPVYRTHFASGSYGYVGTGALNPPAPAVDLHAEWSGTGDQICVTAIAPFLGTEPRLAAVALATPEGAVGARMSPPGGLQLAFNAAPRSMRLPLAPDGEPCELALRLTRDDAPLGHLVVRPGGGHAVSGKESVQIRVPERFRWDTDAAGRLLPVYA